MRAGVLALQGDWAAHREALARLGVPADPIRTTAQLVSVDALVMPGGESTAMLRLAAPAGLDRAIADRVAGGMPVLATCAGLILLSRKVDPPQASLGVLDVDVVRNAYGRQLHSRITWIDVDAAFGPPASMEAVFIRAPRVSRVGAGVEVLGRLAADPVVVRQRNVLAVTFHPELTDDLRIHEAFVRLGEG